MKYIVILSLLLSSFISYAGEGIHFEKGTFQEALDKANKEGKLIFMDAYATWCGPCRAMAANVFTDQEVAAYYNENFINLKIDMERGEGPKLKKKYRVSAYPTLLFLNSDGDVVKSKRGGMRAPDFIALGRATQKAYFDITKIEELYNGGDKSPKVLYEYASGLKKKGEPYQAIANEYFRTDKIEYDTHYIDAIYDLTPNFDSKMFESFITNLDALKVKYGETKMEQKWNKLANATLSRALEFKEKSLLDLSINTMNEYSADKSFEAVAQMSYYTSAEPNLNSYIKAGNAYLENTDDLDDRHMFLERLVTFFPSKKAAKKGLSYTDKLLASGKKAKYFLLAGRLNALNGDGAKAQELGTKALEIAKTDKLKLQPYQKFLKEIQPAN